MNIPSIRVLQAVGDQVDTDTFPPAHGYASSPASFAGVVCVSVTDQLIIRLTVADEGSQDSPMSMIMSIFASSPLVADLIDWKP